MAGPDKTEREVYGGPAREEWRGLRPYAIAGAAYIGIAQVYPGILYSFMTGMIFLLVCVYFIPKGWRRLTKRDDAPEDQAS